MKKIFPIIFIILLSGGLYALTLRGAWGNPAPGDFKGNLDRPTRPLELSPERGRFASVLALGEFGRYDLGQELAEAVYPDVGFYGGKFYTFFAPGIAYLALPFYLWGKIYNLSQVFTFAFVALISILSLLVLYQIARKIFSLPLWAALAVVLTFAFATTSWSYAVTLYQHHFTVFFMLSSFYAAWRFKQRGRHSWLWGIWVWLAYGLAVSVDYPNAVLMLPAVIYFLLVSVQIFRQQDKLRLSIRGAFFATAIFLFAAAGLNAYHSQTHFGSWRRLSGALPAYRDIKQQDLLAQPDSAAAIEFLAREKGLTNFFDETNIPFSFYTLVFSPERGLLFYSPVMLLGLLGIFSLRRKFNLEYQVSAALVAVNVLLYSSWGDPWGGWAYGPRYLIPSMAVLSLFIGAFLAAYGRRLWVKLLIFVLLAYSSGIALLGAVTSNAVPPKIEALNLPLKYYNYLYNLYLLRRNQGGSFVYNTYLSHSISLQEYYLIIWGALLAVIWIVLFVVPRLTVPDNGKLKNQNGR